MEELFKDIQQHVLNFVKAYDYKTELEVILGTKVTKLSVLYKTDYFKPDNEYYKKGIGDIIIQFDSGYKIVIKNTVSGTWSFAVLNKPYNVIEEVWYISEEQRNILPNLIPLLEKGYPYRNSFSNLHIIKEDT